MKNPLNMSKRAYSAILQIPELLDRVREQEQQLRELRERVDDLANRQITDRNWLESETQYTDTLLNLYCGALYRQITGSADLKQFFYHIPAATGERRLYQEGCKKLLDVLDELCHAHKLKYWLECGTLLGAVRHGGFIPWDDDLDVGMMRGDILKLREILKHDRRFRVTLVYDFLARNRQYRFRTTDPENACFVDLFIFDYGTDPEAVGSGKWLSEREQKQQNVLAGLTPAEAEQWQAEYMVDEHSALGKKLTRLYAMHYPTVANARSERTPDVVWAVDNCFSGPNPSLAYDSLFPLGKIRFEGAEYPCPRDYGLQLQNLYGDIYTLPKDIVDHFKHVNFKRMDSVAIRKFLAKK